METTNVSFEMSQTLNKEKLICPGCKFTCTSMQNLRIHFQQTNHKPIYVKLQQCNASSHLKNTKALNRLAKIPDHNRRVILDLKDYMQRTDREPLIGLECILEYRVETGPDTVAIKYFCDICDLDSELVPMVEHLSGVKHQRLYLAKEFPYVLKAPSNSKENRSQFIRRMAMEIEEEEGIKMFKTDPIIRMESIMNVKTSEAKQSTRNTRWNIEGNKQTRMNKALEYLESFEIDNDTEASTVTRLTEKLTAELKFYSNKLKEQALFPAKVARAKDVAMSIFQKITRERLNQASTQPQPSPQNPVCQLPTQLFNRGPPEKIHLNNYVDMPSDHPGPQIPSSDRSNCAKSPMATPQCSKPHAFFPVKENCQEMPAAKTAEQSKKEKTYKSDSELPSDPCAENVTFVKKLITLPSELSHNTTPIEPDVFSKEYNEFSYGNVSTNIAAQQYENHVDDQAPYTKIERSPSSARFGNERFQDSDSEKGIVNQSQKTRHGHDIHSSISFDDPLISFDDPEWAQRGSGMAYGKCARLYRDYISPHCTERGEQHPDETRGINATNLSIDLLKRIRGKDLLTVSAILSEYAERPYK